MRRTHQRCFPRVAILCAGREDGRELSSGTVESQNRSIPTYREHEIWIKRIGRDVTTFESARGKPITISNHAEVAAREYCDRTAVLLGRVQSIGKLIVGRDVIHLAGRLIEPFGPGAAAIQGDHSSLIRSHEDAL